MMTSAMPGDEADRVQAWVCESNGAEDAFASVHLNHMAGRHTGIQW